MLLRQNLNPCDTMADDAPTAAAPPGIQLEGGTYEIIRNRLNAQARELRSRLEQLNPARKDVFGSIETRLLSTERISTDHNCIPRDLVAVGNRFIFGYNVHLGLKTETELSDVFAVYEFRDGTFHRQELDLIRDERFIRDIKGDLSLLPQRRLRQVLDHRPALFMVFRVGKSVTDIKTFKWAIDGDRLVYLDNRSDHEFRYPAARIRMDAHHPRSAPHGLHPHISIHDRVFVETVGGDLTIKIENNTDSGEGIYAEDGGQTRPDAGRRRILLCHRRQPDPAEDPPVPGTRLPLHRLQREDPAGPPPGLHRCRLRAAARRPRDHLLQRLLPADRRVQGLRERADRHAVRAAAGGAQRRRLPVRLLQPRQRRPRAAALQPDRTAGRRRRCCATAPPFSRRRADLLPRPAEPQKHHALQIWQTPYVGEDYVPEAKTDSFLFKIGNRDLVRGMAECHEVLNLIAKEDTYANLYVDLAKLAGDVIDAYFWIDSAGVLPPGGGAGGDPQHGVGRDRGVRKGHAAVGRTRRRAKPVASARRPGRSWLRVHRRRFDHVDDFVRSLADLRSIRGEAIALRDLRYIDLELVDKLEKEVVEQSDRLAQRCVQFLLNPASPAAVPSGSRRTPLRSIS
jgi:hypothetical protein